VQPPPGCPTGTCIPSPVIQETGQLGLQQVSRGATVGGILIALGVLAMTAGLIRSETAGDLRTLTATGAGGRTSLMAAVAGWLLGGRAPSAVARRPLE
jgi:putative ABC transport system permease protein